MAELDTAIKNLIEDFHATVLPAHIKRMVKRDLSLGTPFEPAPGNLVKVVVGMRRSGKTYRLFQEIDALLKSGVPSAKICYFNFDDDRLRPFDSSVIDRVVECFFELHPESRVEGAYLFFDEIQEVPEWEHSGKTHRGYRKGNGVRYGFFFEDAFYRCCHAVPRALDILRAFAFELFRIPSLSRN